MVPEETYFVSISLFRLNAIFDAGHATRHASQWKADFLNHSYNQVQKVRFSVPRRWDEARNREPERSGSYVRIGDFG
jgi:hypothetical protein